MALIQGNETLFDKKQEALEQLAKSIISYRGKPIPLAAEDFINAGWTKDDLVDIIIEIGEKSIKNYRNGTIKMPLNPTSWQKNKP